jgi:AcrR family transcriptional regulator
MKKGERTAEDIIIAAIKMAEDVGYENVRRERLGRELGLSPSLVNKYYRTMDQFKRAIMRRAVKEGNATIVMQGLVARDPHARKASDELKAAAIATVV